MKAKLIVLIVVIAALAGCGLYVWHEYDAAEASLVPVEPIRIAGQEVLPSEGSLESRVPVLGGLLHKDFTFHLPDGAAGDAGNAATAPGAVSLGEVGLAPYSLTYEFPSDALGDGIDYDHFLTLAGGVPLTSGAEVDSSQSAGENGAYRITLPGDYEITVIGRVADPGTDSGAPSKAVTTGTITYRASFSVTMPPPLFKAGRAELQQGDIYTLSLRNVPEGVIPTLETELGPATFAKVAPGAIDETFETVPGLTNWLAEIPISNHRAPGTYAVKATAGDQLYEESVTVSLYDYDFQNLIIDTSVPSVAEAITGKAVAEFREKVGKLMPLITDEIYWQGYFEMPVDLGNKWFISTRFGEIRITNGDQGTRRSHYGMDFAVPTGTPVRAGNTGKVLLAEDLLNTGNTVVIDHGGGLKSYYYHMSALHTETGAMVTKGDLIGEVGSEGYSTGPHLHYEMRIGDQAISPSMLFDPTAGLYSAE
ncbi:MAG: M23 family metallopeptidase [Clostridiales Family XIII bacterium]|jgi:murein DD-endopeptidase MepM/ murein hydrolase activator NlpD|nr:M23 family metallopeptidase [Clostridiales Family XIII bacterium]